MTLMTERLCLRAWRETDAESLYMYASAPEVGPIAGWQPHRSVTESLSVIRNCLSGAEHYAICERDKDEAIGAIALHLKEKTDMTEREDECELGYWLGKPFWDRGYMTEAGAELLRHAFVDLQMNAVWCGYYEGNERSARVQQKLGFHPHHFSENLPVPQMHEIRTGYVNLLTKADWEKQTKRGTLK